MSASIRVGQVAIPVAFVLAAVAAALLASLAGIQWVIVGVIVGGGIAHSVLRATSLDPMGWVHGSSEIPGRGGQGFGGSMLSGSHASG